MNPWIYGPLFGFIAGAAVMLWCCWPAVSLVMRESKKAAADPEKK